MALKKSNAKNDPISTVLGIVGSLLTILVVTGVVTQEEMTALMDNIAVLIPSGISIVTSVILIFSRIFHKE